ncbi:hypothetical protein NQ317_017389 [Molorchus minor]|uniref:N-acetylneuraminate lyase n=1 Tax=Molorchus minor TaxID=1323400 RepID=A0ABQ9J0X5_9CUCU|nr:hypothetical protein NQ317_017389 [Molorchus minor]
MPTLNITVSVEDESLNQKGVGLRYKGSHKKECPAYIRATASSDGQALIIRETCYTHNHYIEQPIEYIDVLIDEDYDPQIVNFTFRGLCAPVFTAFNKDLSVNVSVIPRYAQFLADNDIKGVLIHGSTGEGVSLSVEERKSVVEEWASAVQTTKQHLMIQVGGCPLPDVLELARHAEKIVNMSNFLNEIVGKVPTFVGIKYKSNDLDDTIMAGAFAMEAVKAENLEEARAVQEELSVACSVITQNGAWVPTMKVAMNLTTPIDVGAVRPPLDNISTRHADQMQTALKLFLCCNRTVRVFINCN